MKLFAEIIQYIAIETVWKLSMRKYTIVYNGASTCIYTLFFVPSSSLDIFHKNSENLRINNFLSGLIKSTV